ncbi:MAG: hypothetical protein QM771_00180 [Nitrospira sp.]
MMNDQEEQLRRAIGTLLQSDPLIKLLQEVRLGRINATDAGLRAVVESWIGTYAQVLKSQTLNAELLARLDPVPRLEVLVDAGVLSWAHSATCELRDLFRSLAVPAA